MPRGGYIETMASNPEPRITESSIPASPAELQRSRLGGLWLILASGAVILVLLLVFILQNGQRVEVHLYGAHWSAPLGVALLMAAAFGVLLVVVPGAGRILQLKRAALRLHSQRQRLAAQIDRRGRPDVPAVDADADAGEPETAVTAPEAREARREAAESATDSTAAPTTD